MAPSREAEGGQGKSPSASSPVDGLEGLVGDVTVTTIQDLTPQEFTNLLHDKEEEIKELKELHLVEQTSLQDSLNKAQDSLRRAQRDHQADKEASQRQCIELQKLLARRDSELQASRGIVTVLEQHVDRLNEDAKGMKGERDEAQRCLKEAGRVVSTQAQGLGEMQNVIHELEGERNHLLAQLRDMQTMVGQLRQAETKDGVCAVRVQELQAAVEELEREKAGLASQLESLRLEGTARRMDVESAHERLKGVFKRETASMKDLLMQRDREIQSLSAKGARLEAKVLGLRKELAEKDQVLAAMGGEARVIQEGSGMGATSSSPPSPTASVSAELQAARDLITALQQSFLGKVKEAKAMEADKSETQRQLDLALSDLDRLRSMAEEDKHTLVVHDEGDAMEMGSEMRGSCHGHEEEIRALKGQVERLTRESGQLATVLDQVQVSRDNVEEHLRVVIEEKQGLVNEVQELRSRLGTLGKEREDREREMAAREFMLSVREREAAQGAGGMSPSSRANVLRPVVDNLQRMLVEKIREVKELKSALASGGPPTPRSSSSSGGYEEVGGNGCCCHDSPTSSVGCPPASTAMSLQGKSLGGWRLFDMDRHMAMGALSFLPWLLWVLTLALVMVHGPRRGGGRCDMSFDRNKELEELLDLYRSMVGRA